jgi:XTP/dITP diphosphohydrolase
MQKLLIATKNKGKIKEIGNFLKDLPVQLVSLKDVGITEEVVEDGTTYEENSRKKALFYANLSHLPSISDDGGLEIDALGGMPGLKSRRWLGYEGTDEELMEHLQKVSRKLPEENRYAKFITVVTFALPSGRYWSKKGVVCGIIAKEPHKKILRGYPYRSFFYLTDIQKFYHENELTEDETREYNHRWKAINALKQIIKKELYL